jgi:hypothetical protein
MPDDEFEMLDDGLSAPEIERLQLTRARLLAAIQGGEIAHLTEAEILTLIHNAGQRDMQRTILR